MTIEVTILFSFPALVFGQLVPRLSHSYELLLVIVMRTVAAMQRLSGIDDFSYLLILSYLCS